MVSRGVQSSLLLKSCSVRSLNLDAGPPAWPEAGAGGAKRVEVHVRSLIHRCTWLDSRTSEDSCYRLLLETQRRREQHLPGTTGVGRVCLAAAVPVVLLVEQVVR